MPRERFSKQHYESLREVSSSCLFLFLAAGSEIEAVFFTKKPTNPHFIFAFYSLLAQGFDRSEAANQLRMYMLNQLTISELASKLARREVSARALTEACLAQIQRVD